MTFSSLGLAEPLLRAVADKGYSSPSPIQEKAIPVVLSGHDLMAAAQTGTGKTAGFTLPLLHRLAEGKPARPNHVRTLILTPTRELAAQVGESVSDYGRYLNLRSTVVFGGVKINPQMMALRKGVDVLVATPGRLLDLHSQNAVKFDHLECLVLDEADRMLDMGFIHDIRRILKLLPAKRQNLLFSATFSEEIKRLAGGILHNPQSVAVSPPNSTAERVEQWMHPVDKSRKPALLSHLIRSEQWGQVLVFTRTKHGANRLAEKLCKDGIQSMAIHGNKSQGARTRALSGFKAGEVQVLVATDIAARGLDIDQLPRVVNFELPNVAEDYVHRIGRTGRAGASGQAVSLVCSEEVKELVSIERLIQRKLERQMVVNFEPAQALPDQPLKTPPKAKKPKKAKPAQGADARAPRQAEGGRSSKTEHRAGRPAQRVSRPASAEQPAAREGAPKAPRNKASVGLGKPGRRSSRRSASKVSA
ncbi:DEAD/DEAH box helicase [Aestuariirhabdus litorea]|uniref:ATP-dependent RNA helicase RhlE n=1 Tax=Aestuariirhabdus litorea TaxID=2528527 RepID=A0A3P3VNI4_9GAMM|nr:DEAD/DEAH box helicase [Aestuariirhabdus litorea]RRJ83984.1 ATP-dependent helicase [Aestuariirhabdus litorea]RWW97204.1 DEAD/DEAH box helicase [Endozoicomonadaceae bacterium GTF-13]